MTTRDRPAEELLIGCLLSGRELALPAAQRAGLQPRHWTDTYLASVYARLIAPGGADADMTHIAGDESLGRERLIRLYCEYHTWHEGIEQGRFQRWLAMQQAGEKACQPESLPDYRVFAQGIPGTKYLPPLFKTALCHRLNHYIDIRRVVKVPVRKNDGIEGGRV